MSIRMIMNIRMTTAITPMIMTASEMPAQRSSGRNAGFDPRSRHRRPRPTKPKTNLATIVTTIMATNAMTSRFTRSMRAKTRLTPMTRHAPRTMAPSTMNMPVKPTPHRTTSMPQPRMATNTTTTRTRTATTPRKNRSNPSAVTTCWRKFRSAPSVRAASTRSRKSSSAARSCWSRSSRKNAATRVRR